MTFWEDLKGMKVTWREATRVANNHQQWRNLVAQCSHRDSRTQVQAVIKSCVY